MKRESVAQQQGMFPEERQEWKAVGERRWLPQKEFQSKARIKWFVKRLEDDKRISKTWRGKQFLVFLLIEWRKREKKKKKKQSWRRNGIKHPGPFSRSLFMVVKGMLLPLMLQSLHRFQFWSWKMSLQHLLPHVLFLTSWKNHYFFISFSSASLLSPLLSFFYRDDDSGIIACCPHQLCMCLWGKLLHNKKERKRWKRRDEKQGEERAFLFHHESPVDDESKSDACKTSSSIGIELLFHFFSSSSFFTRFSRSKVNVLTGGVLTRGQARKWKSEREWNHSM